jgi:hypothetical protein
MSANVFTDGIPLESDCPIAHNGIIVAAMFLSRSHDESYLDRSRAFYSDQASARARDVAKELHSHYKTGSQTVWLAVVRYMVELHAARLDAERENY